MPFMWVKHFLPASLRGLLRARHLRIRRQWIRATGVDFGRMRRMTPISRVFGLDRGRPIDRYYIERFLHRHAADIRGRVLEIGDDRYIRQFGGDRVAQADVLHYVDGNPKATIVDDLTRAEQIPAETFDCIICTQTLQMIYDAPAAFRQLHRILKPGGVLLATAHGTSRICRREGTDDWGEYWRFTSQSLTRMAAEPFGRDNVLATPYGNVFAAIAFLHGLATEELTQEELDTLDPDYEVLLSLRAVKAK
ncbi:MAG TPA: methyltransferase domain-containing protein [Candidatus Acidoferrales bacterium]|nr:methyltransferase domain-containing protein [Candidatus Acidoferrales bacterium]